MEPNEVVHIALSERGAEFLKAAVEDQISEVGDEDGIYNAILEDINEQLARKPATKRKAAKKK